MMTRFSQDRLLHVEVPPTSSARYGTRSTPKVWEVVLKGLQTTRAGGVRGLRSWPHTTFPGPVKFCHMSRCASGLTGNWRTALSLSPMHLDLALPGLFPSLASLQRQRLSWRAVRILGLSGRKQSQIGSQTSYYCSNYYCLCPLTRPGKYRLLQYLLLHLKQHRWRKLCLRRKNQLFLSVFPGR